MVLPFMPTRISGLIFSMVPAGVGDGAAITAQAAVVLRAAGYPMVAALPGVAMVAATAADMEGADRFG
jgi:hypothetical protein